jgi:NADPH2:quinone reductase
MQIVNVEQFGGPEVLNIIEVPDPQPSKGQIAVDVKASGINFADVMARAGHYGGVPSAPFSPGFEVAGIVSSVGDGVAGFAVGDRVIGLVANGGYASKAVVDASRAVKIPGNLAFDAATALLIQGLTAYFLLEHGQVGPGKTVQISSASGGLGSLAIQIAKLRGAGKVIGLASPGKHDRIKTLGVDYAVDYTKPGWSKEVLEVTDNKGVDIYLDSGGDFAGEGFDTLGAGSWWLIYGGQSNTGKPLAAERFGPIVGKGISLRGYMVYSDVANFPRALTELIGWAAAGKLKIDVQSFPLSKVAEAQTAIENRQTFGKVVLVP